MDIGKVLGDILLLFEKTERLGDEIDVPEGSRYIKISDTLACQLSERLRKIEGLEYPHYPQLESSVVHPKDRCRKCGETQHFTRWIQGETEISGEAMSEYLKKECIGCGYTWEEAPLDRQEKQGDANR